MDNQVITKLKFHEIDYGEIFSSSTLPKTITMANSTSLKYSNKLATTMALEAKRPQKFVVGL